MKGFSLFGATAVMLAVAGTSAVPAFAQVDTARIVGIVEDATGAVIPNAKIELHNPATGLDRTTTSNTKGEYQFLAIPAATYVETVSAPSFAEHKQNVEISVGGSPTIVVKLTAGSDTNVEVQGGNDAIQVNESNPEVSQVITPKEIIDLPSLNRNPYAFVALAGNVTSDPDGSTTRGVGYSFSGQRSAGTEILLDGVENEDNYDAAVGQNIPLDSVEEYRVITNGFDAQYGRAGGGVVNLLTKSGTNQFHGSLYEYNRISALASNTYYEDAENYANRQSGLPNNPADHFTRNQFGYSIGGPIFRNRLFFFSNTEWNRIRSSGQQQFEVPTASYIATLPASVQAYLNANPLSSSARLGATVPVAGFTNNPLQLVTETAPINAGAGDPVNVWETLNRFDYAVNQKISMFFRAADYNAVNFPGFVSLSPYKGFNTSQTQFNQAYLYNLTYAITPSLLSNSKVSYSRQNLNQPLSGAPLPTLYLNQANVESTDATTNIPIVFPGYLPLSPGGAIPFGGPSNIYQFIETMTYVKGGHTITFGGEFFQLRDNRTFGAYENAVEQVSRSGTNYGTALQQLQSGDVYSFEVGIDPQGQLPCSVTAGSTSSTNGLVGNCNINFPANSPNFERENTFNDGSWFAEDTYKVTDRLTLDYGIRWEYYGVQHNHNPNLESNFYPGSGGNEAQNIADGVVLTTPNSPTHGLTKKNLNNYAPRLGFAWDVMGDGKWSVRGGFGISYERNFGNVTYNVIQNPPNYAVVQLVSPGKTPQVQFYGSNLGPFASATGSAQLPPTSLRALDPYMPTAYTEEWQGSVEHQLTPHDLIGIEYSGAHGVHQYAIAGLNGIGYGTFLGSTSGYYTNRLNHQYSGVNQRLANGSSEYEAVNIRYESQNLSRYGLQMSVNYTYSHAMDNLSSTFSESGNNFNLGYLNPFNPRLDWGNADYDVRHRVAVGGVYQPKFLEFQSSRIAHMILGGFEFAPIATAHTASPFTIYDCTNGENACPRIADAPDVRFHGSVGAYQGGNSFNYLPIPADSHNTFVNSQGYSDFPDTLGGYQNSGLSRNQWFGPGVVTFDMGVYKNFAFGSNDRYTVQLRGEFYNVLNHSNYYPVVSTADYAEVTNVNVEKGTPGGGSPSSSDERRNTQLAVRFQF